MCIREGLFPLQSAGFLDLELFLCWNIQGFSSGLVKHVCGKNPKETVAKNTCIKQIHFAETRTPI